MVKINKNTLRSRLWFDNSENPGMTALYLERYLNFGLTPEELRSGKPIIGIAQTGSDLSPCNRIHLKLANRVRDGIIESGGLPLEFPVHPIQESGRRPTASLDRNLAYLGLVEILHGYPFDGVVLTTGCDKTTPACLMAAATVNIPSIVLSSGPMLDGSYNGDLAGSGTVIWDCRIKLAAGEINYDEFIERVSSSSPSEGHCNTMGTASTMNSLAEAMGMSLTGNANIPAPYRERGQMAYKTGQRIVEMVFEDLTPSKILTKESFINAIVVNSAIGGSSNAQPHLTAIAKHSGINLDPNSWQVHGYDIPLLVNMQPAGHFLGERFYRAGGVSAVMNELLSHGKINGTLLTVTGKTLSENLYNSLIKDPEVIYSYSKPFKKSSGFLVLKGNLFDFAIMKTSVISEHFKNSYLNNKNSEGVINGKALVFENSEDYHKRVNDQSLEMDENSILIMRGSGVVGWPGSAEVVNMQPSDKLISKGVLELPCIGDGRQSGTSGSPSILHASPESSVGGGLALVKTGDRICIDLNKCTVNMLVSDEELKKRKKNLKIYTVKSQTPWQEIYRSNVSQLSEGAIIKKAIKYRNIRKKIPRDSH